MTFYHYTCDHGRAGIGDSGKLLPNGSDDMPLVVWVTDLPEPDLVGLGLTSTILSCERWKYRYRVTDERSILPYHQMQHQIDWRVQLSLHHAGSMPEHWFVSFRPLAAVYDPIEVVV